MQRRKFLATVGSLTAASAAAIGTGAFSSVTASRAITVQVKGDSNAYLGISGDPDYTSETDGTLEINLDGNGNGSGLNGDATTEFADLLTVSNQGTKNALVWVDLNDLNDQLSSGYVTAYLSMDDYGAGMDGGGGTSATQGTSGAPGQWGVFVAPGYTAEIALGFYNIPEEDINSVYEADIGINAASKDSEMFNNVVSNYTFPSEGTASVDFIDS